MLSKIQPIQYHFSQLTNISENNIIAVQNLYDAYGRAVAKTLPAPINLTCFCYKTSFVTNTANAVYSYNDFDIPNYSNFLNNTSMSSFLRIPGLRCPTSFFYSPIRSQFLRLNISDAEFTERANKVSDKGESDMIIITQDSTIYASEQTTISSFIKD